MIPKLEEIMTKDVRTVAPSANITEVAKIMKEIDVGVVPVVDQDQVVKGVVTDRDIVVAGLAEKGSADFAAEEVMTTNPETCPPDTDVNDAFRLMSDEQIRRLPVTDQNNKLVGIVSIGDLAVNDKGEVRTGFTLDHISRPSHPKQ
ncbi:CBS domain-containing protein [Bacillus marinisedimentorum]|uniref:CBS domain-containing protein n=1 Tax=Bacillus marinisedimentorum TaxID=1821260 RepID=UPI00147172A6|nr:CBS domain-containing protein [Bacillus marinisedimentorum]